MVAKSFEDVQAELFGNAEHKLEHARKHLQAMTDCLISPLHRPGAGHLIAMASSPMTHVHHPWQQEFWPELSAFLHSTRGVPNIIAYGFGWDRPDLNTWLRKLDPPEQSRRKAFHQAFKVHFDKFRLHPLDNERHETEHRSGKPHAEAVIKGLYGTYTARPGGDPIPAVELPRTPGDSKLVAGNDPALQCMAAIGSGWPLSPDWRNLWWVIPQADGSEKRLELFPQCQGFVAAAADLVNQAGALCLRYHAGQPLTKPA